MSYSMAYCTVLIPMIQLWSFEEFVKNRLASTGQAGQLIAQPGHDFHLVTNFKFNK